jgi:hypothetical protein
MGQALAEIRSDAEGYSAERLIGHHPKAVLSRFRIRMTLHFQFAPLHVQELAPTVKM